LRLRCQREGVDAQPKGEHEARGERRCLHNYLNKKIKSESFEFEEY